MLLLPLPPLPEELCITAFAASAIVDIDEEAWPAQAAIRDAIALRVDEGWVPAAAPLT
jgi:hypothetical protein